MMKEEFEKLAGYEVTMDNYLKIIEPMYLATDLSKHEFVKMLNPKALAAPKVKTKNIKKMRVRNRSGQSTTPNGCYYYIQYVELVDIDIRTGKFIVKPLTDEELCKISSEGYDLNYNYEFDFDYLQCVDDQKKPIKLFWFE